jgi:hypothetical protein
MVMKHLDKCALDAYIHLCSMRGLSFNELMRTLSEDFKDISYANKNLTAIQVQYRKILKEIRK